MSKTTTVHRKLVRDGIPAKIEAHGEIAVTRILTNEEFVDALIDKIKEEAEEVRAARSSTEQLAELGDLSEVFKTLIAALGHQPDHVDQARVAKRTQVGGFAERLWLESTEAVSQ